MIFKCTNTLTRCIVLSNRVMFSVAYYQNCVPIRILKPSFIFEKSRFIFQNRHSLHGKYSIRYLHILLKHTFTRVTYDFHMENLLRKTPWHNHKSQFYLSFHYVSAESNYGSPLDGETHILVGVLGRRYKIHKY